MRVFFFLKKKNDMLEHKCKVTKWKLANSFLESTKNCKMDASNNLKFYITGMMNTNPFSDPTSNEHPFTVQRTIMDWK